MIDGINTAKISSTVSRLALISLLATSAAAQVRDLPAPSGAPGPQEAGLEGDIIVTGSRIARSGFTAPTPVTQIGTDRIQAFAATNIGEVLNDLPAFRETISPATSGAQNGSGGNLGARYLDLRALGPNRTLVLVDGKRFVPSSILNTVDTNLIPAMLIERAEVVTGGASAAYGSDAVAGVVNIKLNHTLEGVRAQVQKGIAQAGDDQSTQFALAAGTSFADGRGHLIIAGEYSDDKGADNCYSRDWCSPEWTNFNNPYFRASPGQPANGQPAFVVSQHFHSATFSPGGLITNGPLKGTKFLADGTPAKFEYGEWPGTFWMRGGEGHGDNPVVAPSRLKIAVQRYSLYSHGAYEISDGLTVDFDASYGRVKANNHSSRLYERNLLFQIDNAFLPAQIKQDMLDRGLSSILIGRQGDDFGDARGYGDTQTYRGQIGLKGGISGTWKWDAYYQYGRSDYRLEVRNNKNKNNFLYAIDAIETPGGTVCRALTSPDPLVLAAAAGCQPLNIIGENNWSQAGYDYAFGTAVQTQRMEQHVIAANVNGELFSTWAGPVLIAAGVEHRQDKAAASADAVGQRAGWNLGNGATFAGRIKVTEGYLEANVPLARDMAFANLLELNGAIRYADYSTSGGVTTWKVGTIWEPTASVRLRATKSRDIRAPNVLELFSAGSVSPGRVTDKPSNIDALPSVRTGGNLDLVPEVADTWTAGIVLTPDFIPNLRVSADWFDIKIDGAITSLAPQLIIDRCFQGAANLCDLITRDAAGVITFINAPLLNLNSFVTRGLDLEAAYRLDLGGTSALDFRLLGTYVKDLISTDAAGSIDRAGQTGAQSLGAQGLPKWTLNGNVVYNSGPVTLSLEGRYIPRGVYDKTLVGPQDAGYDPQLPNSIDDNRVGGRFYTNVGFQFRVPHRTHAFEFYGAIQNLFDKDPPIAPWNGIGTNGVMFDTIGRSFRVGARLRY